MEEVWKDIPSYEGIYKVSNLGKVKSISWFDPKNKKYYKRDKLLKPRKTDKGYIEVTLTNKYKKKIYKVHRIVAEAFIPNNNNLPQINHIDEDKSNNSVNNLEWCTAEYNIRYSKCKKVKQYNMNKEFIREWDSITDASTELNIPTTHISKCCKGILKKTHNYIWEYSD